MMRKSRTFIATPPGATIKDQISDRGMSQKDFASRMEMSEKHISNLINGEVQLTPEVAIRLEMVLGIPASFWNNLESRYREKLKEIEKENQMDADIEFAKKIPYNEMVKNEWITKAENKFEKVWNLRKFFEVTRLGLLEENKVCNVMCRRLATTDKADMDLLVWSQEAKLKARDIQTKPIDLKTLEKNIPVIKSMTRKDPKEFFKQLVQIMADCGIAMVLLPHMEGSFLHGATFYDSNKIVMGLTVRGKDADKFWFSLFHELGHILLGHIGNLLSDEQDEKKADEFAKECLIPKKLFDEFVSEDNLSENAIIRFAEKADINPGIVVGRLQKEGYVPYNRYNNLKTQYELVLK